MEKDYGKYLDKVYFMPMVKLPNKKAKAIVDDYLENTPPIAFAFGVPQDTIQLINYFDEIRKKGSSVWVNSLWKTTQWVVMTTKKPQLDPTVYDWYIDNSIDIIQDRQTPTTARLLKIQRSSSVNLGFKFCSLQKPTIFC